MSRFVGRKYELKTLKSVLYLRSASFIVVNGRRRIGKSRLIAEFAKAYTFYRFTGLAPRKGMVSQDQRNEFMRQFREQFDLPIAGIDDWGTLFTLLAKQTRRGRIVILFDEISWMAHDDPDFLGKLKNAWDDLFKLNSKVILFLCGSVSSWIEKNLLSSTAFMGRPTLHLTLNELGLPECNQFWEGAGSIISAYEKLKVLAITGGVPRYLELINPALSAEENIKNLFFRAESALFDEFKNIFKDVYEKRSNLYQSIIELLISGPLSQEQLSELLQKARSGDIGDYLNDLVLGGFVSRDYSWQIKTAKVSNLSVYRLCDNYLRFALKYIMPNQMLIEKRRFQDRSLKTLPGWDPLLGLQFENLVLRNHKQVIARLGLLAEDVVIDNPYFQRKTARVKGCQIDYLIQTRHDAVYVCEIRFSRNPINSKIIEEMQEKLERLAVPKHITKRPVLIHVNGITEPVLDSRYFSHIINFGDLLTSE